MVAGILYIALIRLNLYPLFVSIIRGLVAVGLMWPSCSPQLAASIDSAIRAQAAALQDNEVLELLRHLGTLGVRWAALKGATRAAVVGRLRKDNFSVVRDRPVEGSACSSAVFTGRQAAATDTTTYNKNDGNNTINSSNNVGTIVQAHMANPAVARSQEQRKHDTVHSVFVRLGAIGATYNKLPPTVAAALTTTALARLAESQLSVWRHFGLWSDHMNRVSIRREVGKVAHDSPAKKAKIKDRGGVVKNDTVGSTTVVAHSVAESVSAAIGVMTEGVDALTDWGLRWHHISTAQRDIVFLPLRCAIEQCIKLSDFEADLQFHLHAMAVSDKTDVSSPFLGTGDVNGASNTSREGLTTTRRGVVAGIDGRLKWQSKKSGTTSAAQEGSWSMGGRARPSVATAAVALQGQGGQRVEAHLEAYSDLLGALQCLHSLGVRWVKIEILF